jgi:Zn-dependent protease
MLSQGQLAAPGRAAAQLIERASGPFDLLARLLPIAAVQEVLKAIGLDLSKIEADLQAQRDNVAGVEQIARYAAREAGLLGHQRVDPIHLLLALLYTDVAGTPSFLQAHGATLYELRAYLQSPAARQQARRLRRPPAASLRGAVGVSPIFVGLVVLMGLSGGLLLLDLPQWLVMVTTLVFVLSGWLTSLCLHEFAHALIAFLGGDHEISAAGYLRLDPRGYLDPWFSFLLPVLFVLLGGIGLPGGAVYVRTGALRNRRWASAVGAAGPLASLAFTLLVALPFFLQPGLDWFWIHSPDLWGAVALLLLIEAGAFLLNLVPLPPLDGFRILEPVLPEELQLAARRIGNQALLIVFALLWFSPAGAWLWDGAYFLLALARVPLEMTGLGLDHMPQLR